MYNYPQYSTLFTTIYDQPEPVGQIGRGAHYSILRSVEWLDVMRNPLKIPQIHDFAVIWDEDHDTRVIEPIEKMYLAGLLAPVQFVGERKASLTVITAAKFYYGISQEDIKIYKDRISTIADRLDDSWGGVVGLFDKSPDSPQNTDTQGIIHSNVEVVISYLRTIDNLWNLGTKEYFPDQDLLTEWKQSHDLQNNIGGPAGHQKKKQGTPKIIIGELECPKALQDHVDYLVKVRKDITGS